MSRRSISLLTTLKLHVPKKSALLVAVSGGKDSVALIDGLVRLQRMLSLKLEIAHVNHNLRQSSGEDADFVERLSEKYSLPFHQKSLDTPPQKVNIENWGRKERYQFFKGLLTERNLNLIVTAHHSDDVAETFLMRLVSNKELRSISALSHRYQLLRPLLSISKNEIEKYISRYSLDFREDQSNAENKYLRNKVRNLLLPDLQKDFHPKVTQWIAERARVLDRDARCLDHLAKDVLKGIGTLDVGSERFREVLKCQPLAIGLRLIEFALMERFKFRLGQSRARVVRRVILGRIAKCDLPNGYSLNWSNGSLVLQEAEH